MSRIIQSGVDTRELFHIEIVDDGTYFAIRTESPRFVLHGDSIADVADKAQRAFDAIRDLPTPSSASGE